MVYDPQRKEVVLFGGSGLNDTWIWDGQSWLQRSPAIAPPGRTHASMSYDAVHGNLVLFGGTASDGRLLNDTWTWDGQSWTAQANQITPPARCGACMQYDPMTRNVLLFGGQMANERASKLLNDTWIWNGATWTQRRPRVSPSARLGAAIVYHASQQQLLLFGGTTGVTALNDSWHWNGYGWQLLTPASSPPARAWANLVYHASQQHSILIGGNGNGSEPAMMNRADAWLWNGTTWRQHTFVAPAVTTADPHMPQGSHKNAAYVEHLHTMLVYTTNSQKKGIAPTQQNAHLPASWQSETWLLMPS